MFTAKDVKDLREKTGAGMMDCKKALDETKGNMEEAITWLREKGISKAEKKSTRIATEGLSDAASNGNVAAIVEVNCETDFVSRNEEFKTLLKQLVKAIINNDVNTLEELNKVVLDETNETVENTIIAFTAKIGEKISLRRFERVTKTDDEVFGIYSHLGGRITSLVVLEGNNENIAKDVAMQVAAMKPLYLTIDDVPTEVLDHEREIYKEQAMNEGKPVEVALKMVEGRVKKYYKEVCLTEQAFIKDSNMSVSTYAKNNCGNILSMIRYEVGEGMEKRNDNFAEEVMNQINQSNN